MIDLIFEITAYIHDRNEFEAISDSGKNIIVDLFVDAIEISDSDYCGGIGYEFVGKKYIASEYSVRSDCITPYKGFLLLIN